MSLPNTVLPKEMLEVVRPRPVGAGGSFSVSTAIAIETIAA